MSKHNNRQNQNNNTSAEISTEEELTEALTEDESVEEAVEEQPVNSFVPKETITIDEEEAEDVGVIEDAEVPENDLDMGSIDREIAELEAQHAESRNPVEQALLADKIKSLNREKIGISSSTTGLVKDDSRVVTPGSVRANSIRVQL